MQELHMENKNKQKKIKYYWRLIRLHYGPNSFVNLMKSGFQEKQKGVTGDQLKYLKS